MKNNGHLAQIVGECLMMHYESFFVNNISTRNGTDTYGVFCVRMVNYYVNYFRFEVTKKQLEDLCLHGVTPEPVMNLQSHVDNAESNWGLSLLDSKERREALTVMEAIRQQVL